MHAIESARQLIEADRTSKNAKILSSWILALEAKEKFNIDQLFELDVNFFNIALAILEDLRFDNYCINKSKLFDLAVQVSKISVN